jgi:hypothetical protein
MSSQKGITKLQLDVTLRAIILHFCKRGKAQNPYSFNIKLLLQNNPEVNVANVYFYDKQPSLIEIQRHCEEQMEFAECDYGQFLIFPTKALHGTVSNATDKIRVSFDFRICTDNDYGLKNPKFFRSVITGENTNSEKSNATKDIRRPAVGYLSQFPILNTFKISQTIQHEAVTSFCLKNNLDLILLETELVGFTKPLNLEDILFGNRNGLAKDIVIFSDKLVYLENSKYFDLIKKATLNNFRFHFVNEGYVLDSL